MTKRGIFITLEGGEGTGKSTQTKLLQQALSDCGIDVLTTREPGGTPQAELIRNILVQRDSGALDPMTETLLLFAARNEHLINKIFPALEKGQWVISDRFTDSTRAMQGYGMGIDLGIIDGLYKTIAKDFTPDVTFTFDIAAENGLKRSNKQLTQSNNTHEKTEDRYERMSLEFHKKLNKGFIEIAKQDPDNHIIIDAMQDIQTIHREMLNALNTRYDLNCHEAKYG